MPNMVACKSLSSSPRCALLSSFVILGFTLLLGRAAAQQPRTDPTEVLALNTILGRWRIKATSTWNVSGEPCTGEATDSTGIESNLKNFNPAIKCDCNYNNNSVCHITQLLVYALDVVGTIPEELQNLTYLTFLKLDQNYLTGPLPAFIGNLTKLETLSFGINALSGSIPKELGNLEKLTLLGMGTNNFSGSIPPEFGKLTNLQQWYMDSSGVSGELPSTLSSLKNMTILWASDNNFTGSIPDYIGTWTKLTQLRFQGNSFQGPIPSSLSSLTQLTDLRIGDIGNGSSSLSFISDMTSLSTLVLRNCKISATIPSDFSQYKSLKELDLSFNNITGQIPQSLFSLSSLANLFLGNNSLSGALPTQKSASLLNIDLSYNQLSGSFPSWISQQDFLLNLVANNFVVDDSNSSTLPSGLKCLQRNIPCHRGAPIYSSFAINCGGRKTITASDNNVYEIDDAVLRSASYYVTDPNKWGVSSVGSFAGSSDNTYILNSLAQFQDTLDTELFQSSRLSPSSLRYYGLGLQNGNYTIKLQFAETVIPDLPPSKSLGRRVFDIYMQGDLKEKDFDIKKKAGGRSLTAVVRQFTVPVTNNFLEIHFFWAGKGTCCVPNQGDYGASISAISVTPSDFIPTVSNKPPGSNSKNNHTGLIAGVSAGAVVLGLLAIFGILILRRRRRRLKEQYEVLTGLDVKPFMFSYAELRTATEDFNPSNILGEGGFGPVFKGKLTDGRTVAVKQLSASSHQGKGQFLTEIATISAVQHRNLVKLYGCCVEEEKRILVYEYLENKSLDQAIFGKSDLHLDWAQRSDILLGVARGLCYLHEESRLRIVHRDVKASNILLDADLNPKISDFGLAKLYDDKMTHINTRVAGTIGYLAPEYAMRGHLTEKADVFAFGVLALEIVCGRPNSDQSLNQDKVYLLEWAWTLHENNCEMEMVDPKLTSFDEKEIRQVIGIALLCTQASPGQRPPMSRVVAMLVGDTKVTGVAPSRPSYLTDWQQKDVTSSFTGDYSGASNPRLAHSQVSGKSTSSSQPYSGSIIEEGR